DSAAEAASGAPALDRSCADRAQQSGIRPRRAYPQRAVAVLVERMDDAAVQLRVGQELSAVPGRQPAERTDPERAVAGDEERSYEIGGKRSAVRWHPRNGAHAIEAQQAELGPEPQVTVGRLRKCDRLAFGETFADSPRP